MRNKRIRKKYFDLPLFRSMQMKCSPVPEKRKPLGKASSTGCRPAFEYLNKHYHPQINKSGSCSIAKGPHIPSIHSSALSWSYFPSGALIAINYSWSIGQWTSWTSSSASWLSWRTSRTIFLFRRQSTVRSRTAGVIRQLRNQSLLMGTLLKWPQIWRRLCGNSRLRVWWCVMGWCGVYQSAGHAGERSASYANELDRLPSVGSRGLAWCWGWWLDHRDALHF